MEPKLEILPESQRNLWSQLGQIPKIFVLYGGTAIALRFGHRESIDFDFFSSEPFSGDEILSLPLFKTGNLVSRTPGSITLTVDCPDPVKFQFFGGLPLSRVNKPTLLDPPGVLLASPYDLFATKLKVIQDRAEKKDYLDIIEFLNQGYDFSHGLAAAVAVYRNKFKPQITLRAAVSFVDGDLTSLTGYDRQVMEKAVADFWLSKLEAPVTMAESSSLATINSQSIPE
jgi:hypothetical protein